MTEQEARQILGASMDTSWEEVLKVRFSGICTHLSDIQGNMEEVS